MHFDTEVHPHVHSHTRLHRFFFFFFEIFFFPENGRDKHTKVHQTHAITQCIYVVAIK